MIFFFLKSEWIKNIQLNQLHEQQQHNFFWAGPLNEAFKIQKFEQIQKQIILGTWIDNNSNIDKNRISDITLVICDNFM